MRFTAVEELRALLGGVEGRQVDAFVDALAEAGAVFTAGAGRSGLAMRGFAMRLMHMGVAAHVVGGVTSPAFASGDLLVVGSGSGSTATLVPLCEKARSLGGRVALLTTDPGSPMAQRAHVVVRIPAPTPKAAGPGAAAAASSRQPMASLFEQGLWLVLDSVIMMLMERKGKDGAGMFSRHANLE